MVKTQSYKAVWYDDEAMYPCYYLLGISVWGETPEDALIKNLQQLTSEVRNMLHLGDDISDDKIQETLYVIRSDGLVSVWQVKNHQLSNP
jgi:hypothetical protein